MARVQLDHSVENIASCRVALAAGFEIEGVRRGFLPLRDPTAPEEYGATTCACTAWWSPTDSAPARQ